MCNLPTISVAEAERARVCRLCQRPIRMVRLPEFWWDEECLTLPVAVVTRNGREYAHQACLESGETALNMEA